MSTRFGRFLAPLTAAVLLAVGAAPSPATAQATSTWDQIMQTKKVRLGAPPTEPWYFKDTTASAAPGGVKVGDTVWRGVGPGLAKEIAEALGVQLDIVEVTWANAPAALQANQVDFVLALDPTPVRALAIDFVYPILWYPVALLVRENVEAKTWADLNDPKYRLGGVVGSSTEFLMSKNSPKATIQRFQVHSELLAAFQAGRLDGAVTTGPTVDITRARIKMGKSLVPKPVGAYPSGAGIRKEPDRRWRDYLEVVFGYYYNTGKTQEIYDQFLAFRGLDPKEATPIAREAW